MAKVAIVGANGNIGRLLISTLVERGDTAVGVVRKPEQVEEIDRLGAKGALVDIEEVDVAQLVEAIKGCDSIVFTAGAGQGSGPERKQTVDYGGSVLSAQAAEQAGIKRFVQISAIGVDNPIIEDAGESWRAYVAAKRDADDSLRRSDLDWTILRPGRLTDEPGSGKVHLAETVRRDEIPRADVAGLTIACLDDPRTIGRQWEAVGGLDPIPEAIAAAL